MSKIVAGILVVGITSTSTMLPAKAMQVNQVTEANQSTEMNKLMDKFNLKSVDEAPANAKVLKFDTPEQAEKFLNVLQENEADGVLDLTSIASDDELNSGTIDLSNKNISEENFKRYNEFEKSNTSSKVRKLDLSKEDILNNIPSKGMKPKRYETTLKSSRTLGLCKLNFFCTVTVDWSDSKGNYVSRVNSISSALTELSLGNAWTQLSSSSNISSSGKTVTANITGKFDYYILINTSLTSFAGKTETYYTEFYY